MELGDPPAGCISLRVTGEYPLVPAPVSKCSTAVRQNKFENVPGITAGQRSVEAVATLRGDGNCASRPAESRLRKSSRASEIVDCDCCRCDVILVAYFQREHEGRSRSR